MKENSVSSIIICMNKVIDAEYLLQSKIMTKNYAVQYVETITFSIEEYVAYIKSSHS